MTVFVCLGFLAIPVVSDTINIAGTFRVAKNWCWLTIGCQSRKRKSINVSLTQPCFSIMGNLPPTTIPIQMETWKWVGFNKHSAPV